MLYVKMVKKVYEFIQKDAKGEILYLFLIFLFILLKPTYL
jgi:hypothetical protein